MRVLVRVLSFGRSLVKSIVHPSPADWEMWFPAVGTTSSSADSNSRLRSLPRLRSVARLSLSHPRAVPLPSESDPRVRPPGRGHPAWGVSDTQNLDIANQRTFDEGSLPQPEKDRMDVGHDDSKPRTTP